MTAPVPDRVAEVAARRPEDIAVRDRAHALTYSALDARASRVAAGLAARGVGPGHVVGVRLARGVDLVVALLAVWRSGAAYLPVDPGHPAERIAYVLGDSGASLVIGDEVPLAALDAEPVPSRASAAGLAYLMYTSGSTGRPKGVAIRHSSVSATLDALAGRPGFGTDDVLVAVTTAAFDISVVELFLPLLAGGTVVVADRDDAADPARLAGLLAGATVMQATPATWRLLLVDGWSPPPGFRVWCGGEAMPPDLAERLARTGVPVWDLYGPTETTIWSAVSRLGPDGVLTDWAALTGEQVTVVDEDLAPAREGEVYIAGNGLADGYAGRPGLTATRFVPAPGGARRYRTGDLGRVLPDSRVEILGRADHQVKINGHRVELGEIEARLAAHPEVRAAVVHPLATAAGGKRLVGYLTGSPVTAAELTAHLRTMLPDYMVPSDFVWLAEFPLNTNGKVDRGALPAPSGRAAHVAPSTEDEALVARLCAEVLGVPGLGTADDLVALGADSLAAARLVSALRQATGAAPTVADVLRARTVGAVAVLPRHKVPDLDGTRTGPPLTTFGQRALWFLHQLAPEHDSYVEPWAVRLRGPLDVATLRDRLRAILARHEPLRTRFPVVDGEPAPVLEPVPDEPFTMSTAATTDSVDALLAAERPFDLARELPFRAHLVRLADDDHALLVAIHHIACDGLSMDVFARELVSTPDTPLPVRYRDFAAWQETWLAAPEATAQLDHWARTLADADRSTLPTDRPRADVRDTGGALTRFTLPAELVAQLAALGSARGVTGFVLYLAAFQALLAGHAAGRDVVVGIPAAGRPHDDLAGLIGYFANMVVVRTPVTGNPTFGEFLDRTRAAVLDAMDHQDVPFDRVVERVAPDRSLGDNPLFDVSFSYEVADTPTLPIAGAVASPLRVPRRTAKFDLTLDLMLRPDGTVTGEIEYATALYDAVTVDRFARRFRTLLDAVAVDRPVTDLPVLPDEELHELAVFAEPPSPGRVAPGEVVAVSGLVACLKAGAACVVDPSAEFEVPADLPSDDLGVRVPPDALAYVDAEGVAFSHRNLVHSPVFAAWTAGDSAPGDVVSVTYTSVRVLDASLRPVPIGVFGDVWVVGAQVPLGFHDAPRRTASRFVPDPFVAGGRMYRTGSVARFGAGGALEYADDPAPVVVSRPVAVVRRSPVASEVASVVGALLGHDDPDLGENFFDLGGDSLLAMKAVSRLRTRYRVSLTVMDLFATDSIAELVTKIESKLA